MQNIWERTQKHSSPCPFRASVKQSFVKSHSVQKIVTFININTINKSFASVNRCNYQLRNCKNKHCFQNCFSEHAPHQPLIEQIDKSSPQLTLLVKSVLGVNRTFKTKKGIIHRATHIVFIVSEKINL